MPKLQSTATTVAEFDEFMQRATILRLDAHNLEKPLSAALLSSNDSPIQHLEATAQTLNGVVEKIAILQRMILARIALEADRRGLEARLRAEARSTTDDKPT